MKAPRPVKPLPPPRPDYPYPMRKAEAYAIRALATGKANEGQQAMVWQWLVNATGLKRTSFRADNARLTDFAEGARWIGIQLADALTLPAQNLPD